MDVHSFRTATRPYINNNGLMKLYPNSPGEGDPGDGNTLLYNGVMMTYLAINGALTQLDIDQFLAGLKKCKHKLFPMYWRTPLKQNPDDDQKQDDYYGILASLFFSVEHFLAQEILSYGNSTGFVYNIRNPGKWEFKYWFGRFVDFVGFMKICAANKIDLGNYLLLCAVMIANAFNNKNPSGNVKAYLRAAVLKRAGMGGRVIVSIWEWRIRKKYDMIGQSFVGEFPQGHPCTLIDMV